MAKQEALYDQILEAVKKGEVDMTSVASAMAKGSGNRCPCGGGCGGELE